MIHMEIFLQMAIKEHFETSKSFPRMASMGSRRKLSLSEFFQIAGETNSSTMARARTGGVK